MNLKKYVDLLENSGVVGFPTETVYGLAARIDRPAGIENIFTTKERPFFDPLIVHVASIEQAKSLTTSWTVATEVLAQSFWPGPLTLVLPKTTAVNSMITSGLETVGVRQPKHPLALQLISEVGVPLAAPSANKFGRTSPTTAEHVRGEFGNKVEVLDGGPCPVGIESTVLSVAQNGEDVRLQVLRPGAITPPMLRAALEQRGLRVLFEKTKEARLAPGQMKHHYMPEIPLILSSSDLMTSSEVTDEANQKLKNLPDVVEGVRLRKPAGLLTKAALLQLSEDPTLAARELYSQLREASQGNADHLICFLKRSQIGDEWSGVLDRLKKAASLILPEDFAAKI